MGAVHEAEGDLNQALDESIRETLRDINERAPEEARIPVERTSAPAAEPAAEPEAPSTEKPRDGTGKFVKGQQIRHQQASTRTSAAAATPDTPETPKAAPGTEPAAVEGSEPPLKFGAVTVDLARAPSSWKPAAKAAWNALPEDVRKEIYRRETDFSNSVLNGPMKQNADFGQKVQQVFEPYRGIMEAEGATPEVAIGELLKTAALFRGTNQAAKLNAIFNIDKQFNAGLVDHFVRSVQNEVARQTGGTAPAAQPAQQQAQQVFKDPRVDELMASLHRQETERAQREQSMAGDALNTFMAAKNEKGEPKAPFVDNVITDMVSRVSAIRRENPSLAHNDVLQQAYDAAVWANPETRAVLIAQTQAPQVAAAQTALRTTNAKLATVGAMPKRGAIPATAPPQSLDESIRETGRELGLF